MKKTLLAGLVCAGVTLARSSYGNGTIIFDNYASNPYMPIEYFGTDVGVTNSNYHVDLLYALGTQATTNGMSDLGLSVAINPGEVDYFGNHGYFSGGIVTIPGYSTGPVSFDIVCWLTGPGGYANYGLSVENSFDNGRSLVWTEPSVATGLNPANYFAGLPDYSGGPDTNGAPLLFVGAPEPSTFALTGLGFAALALCRRKK